LQLDTTDPAAIQSVLDHLRSAGLVIRRVQPIRPSLEDLFMAAVQQPGGARALPGAQLTPSPGGRGEPQENA